MRREDTGYKPRPRPDISQSEPRIPRRHRSMGTPATLLTVTLMLMVTAEAGRGYMMMQEDMDQDQEDDAVLQQLVELSTRYCQPHLMKSINYR